MMMTKQRHRIYAVMIAFCMIMMQCLLLPVKTFADEQPDFSILGAVGTFTEEETQKIAQRIYDGLESHSSTISLRGGSMPTIAADEATYLGCIFRSVVAGWDVGILTEKNAMPYQLQSNGVIAISPNYLVEDDVYEETYASLMAQMDAAVSGVDAAWSDAEKALYLHEWMSKKFDYDHDEYETEAETNLRHTAYGMLLRDKGVCEGYAWLYGLLLHRVGVDSMMVQSIALNHAWNMLLIDGAWYHVDVTWDDIFATHPGLLTHDYLLLSHDTMYSASHESSDWELINGANAVEMPDSTRYEDAFWNGSIACIEPYQDGTWLAIKQDETASATGWFTKYTFYPEDGSADAEQVMSLNDRWYVSRNYSTYYTNSYIVPAMHGSVLYYTTPDSIMALKNGIVVWLMNLTEEQKALGYLYGLQIEGDTLYYYVAKNANYAATEYSLDLTVYQQYIDAIAGEDTTEEPTTAEETTVTEVATDPVETTTETTTETTEVTETTTETTTEITEETTETEPETTEPTEAPADPTEPEEPVYTYGDSNGDGVVSILDIIALQQYLMGLDPLSIQQAQNSDLTRDGAVDVFDLALLKRALVRKLSLQELLI